MRTSEWYDEGVQRIHNRVINIFKTKLLKYIINEETICFKPTFLFWFDTLDLKNLSTLKKISKTPVEAFQRSPLFLKLIKLLATLELLATFCFNRGYIFINGYSVIESWIKLFTITIESFCNISYKLIWVNCLIQGTFIRVECRNGLIWVTRISS